MRPRVKRLYRVTARFRDSFVDDDGTELAAGYTRSWHYQDKRAAEHRARICRKGLPGRPAAEWVRVEESMPVAWPDQSHETHN